MQSRQVLVVGNVLEAARVCRDESVVLGLGRTGLRLDRAKVDECSDAEGPTVLANSVRAIRSVEGVVGRMWANVSASTPATQMRGLFMRVMWLTMICTADQR